MNSRAELHASSCSHCRSLGNYKHKTHRVLDANRLTGKNQELLKPRVCDSQLRTGMTATGGTEEATPMRAACCHLAALKARNSSWQERGRQLATRRPHSKDTLHSKNVSRIFWVEGLWGVLPF